MLESDAASDGVALADELALAQEAALLHPMTEGEGRALVFEQVLVLDGEGQALDEWSAGARPTLFQREAAARPYRHMDSLEIYEEEAWLDTDDKGNAVRGYRVTRRPNEAPEAAKEPSADVPPELDELAQTWLEMDWTSDERHLVVAVVKDFPEWDVPLQGQPGWHTSEELNEAALARGSRLAERSALYSALTDETLEKAAELGAAVRAASPSSGWALLSVNQAALAYLATSPVFFTVSASDPMEDELGWALGEGGGDSRTDFDDYHDLGYFGQGSVGSEVVVGVMDNVAVVDTACGLRDGVGCSSPTRVDRAFDCETEARAVPMPSTAPCSAGTNTPGSGLCIHPELGSVCCLASSPYPRFSGVPVACEYSTRHLTQTASAVGADYSQGQGNGNALGDAWTASTCSVPSDCQSGICEAGLCAHSSTWEQRATGPAPETRFSLYGRMSNPNGIGLGVATARFYPNDVVSMSIGTGQERCHPRANLVAELEAENLFDDGKLVVACGGNDNMAGTDCLAATCKAWSPASLPKTLAISGYDSSVAACGSSPDLHDCQRLGVAPSTAARQCEGGVTLRVNGVLAIGAGTIIDLVGPSMATHHTRGSTNDLGSDALGAVVTTGAGGCSFATPVVAGVAAVVKEFFVVNGMGWISNPGYLQVIMLLQGDRAFDGDNVFPTETLSTALDRRWGAGRLRARVFDGTVSESAPIALSIKNHAFTAGTSQQTHTWSAFGSTTLPPGTQLIKCALLQDEDFSGSAGVNLDVSDVDLKLRVRTASGGSCASPGADVVTRTDASKDWKSMVAVEASQVPSGLAGRCVTVELIRKFAATGGITSQVACYYSGEQDDAG